MEKRLKILLVAGFLLRCSVFFITELEQVNYYEYGEIAKNIINGNGYSLFCSEDNYLSFPCPDRPAFSSAFMPPGNVYFLLPFFLIDNISLRTALIIFVQILLSTAVIYLMYYYVKNFFNRNYAFLAALITALNPEFIYTVKFVTPTVIYHFLILLFLIIAYKYFEHRTSRLIISLSILSAILIYFRSEALMFIAFVWGYFIYKKDYKNLFAYIIIVLTLIAPWSIRNYMVFHKPVPLATSFGVNLYRGNNPVGFGHYGIPETMAEVKREAQNKPFEIALNDVTTREAFNYIINNPVKTISNSGIKLADLWIYNWHINQVNSIMAIIAYAGFFLIFLIGYVYIFDKSKFIFENFIFIMSSASAMIFFVLPRYQTMLHIMMMPFCAVGISVIFNFFSAKTGLNASLESIISEKKLK